MVRGCFAAARAVTIAVVLKREIAHRSQDVRILATDIDTECCEGRSRRIPDELDHDIPKTYQSYFEPVAAATTKARPWP